MTVDEARVRAILAAYGAEPARWPQAERDAVAAFLAARGDLLAHAMADARTIDAALALSPTPAAPSDEFTRRVLAAAPAGTVAPLRARRVGGFDMRAVAALAACALIGVVVGFGAASGEDATAAEADAAFGAAFALSGGSEG